MTGLGFFAPFPLALMLPFMAGQSMIMGLAFGTSYQYGKRKISSLTNEQFNQLDAEKLGKQLITDYNAIIPSLSEAVKSSSDFQSTVIKELIDVAKNLPGDFWSGLWGTSAPSSQQTDTSASNVFYGGSIGIPAGIIKGVDPVIDQDMIDELAKAYMNATGITDFENAKKAIIDKINADKAAAEKVQADIDKSKAAAAKITTRVPIDTSIRIPGTAGFKTPAQHLATQKANKAALLRNLSSAQANLKLKELEAIRFRRYAKQVLHNVSLGRASTLTGQNMRKALRTVENILKDAKQKVVNIQRLLRNIKI